MAQTVLFYPPELPQTSLLSDYNETIPEGRTKSSLPTGVGKSHAFWLGIRKITVATNLTTNQWARLQRFWRYETSRGILPFFMVSGPLNRKQLLTPAGLGVTTHGGTRVLVPRSWLCRFGDTPPAISQAMTGSLFKVSFPLEVLPE